MTTERLLDELRSQLNAIRGAIALIEQMLANEHDDNKRARMLNHLAKMRAKKAKKRNTSAHKWSASQRTKFLATMRAKRANVKD